MYTDLEADYLDWYLITLASEFHREQINLLENIANVENKNRNNNPSIYDMIHISYHIHKQLPVYSIPTSCSNLKSKYLEQ